MQTHLDDSNGASDERSQELQWFDRATLTPIPPPMLPPDGISGDRMWRARGWSTED